MIKECIQVAYGILNPANIIVLKGGFKIRKDLKGIHAWRLENGLSIFSHRYGCILAYLDRKRVVVTIIGAVQGKWNGACI